MAEFYNIEDETFVAPGGRLKAVDELHGVEQPEVVVVVAETPQVEPAPAKHLRVKSTNMTEVHKDYFVQ